MSRPLFKALREQSAPADDLAPGDHRAMLLRAIRQGQTPEALFLASSMPGFDFHDGHHSPVAAACEKGDADVLRFLILRGAPYGSKVPTENRRNIVPPVFFCALSTDEGAADILGSWPGSESICQPSGPAVDTRGRNILHWFALHAGRSPLSLAALSIIAADSIPVLLASRDQDGLTPLHLAAARSDHRESGPLEDLCRLAGAGLLLDRISSKETHCSTPLHIAASKGNHAAIRILLAAGAIPLTDIRGHTPLSLLLTRAESPAGSEALVRSAALLLLAGDTPDIPSDGQPRNPDSAREKTIAAARLEADALSATTPATVVRSTPRRLLLRLADGSASFLDTRDDPVLSVLAPGDTLDVVPDPLVPGSCSCPDTRALLETLMTEPEELSVLSRRATGRKP